MADEPSDRSRDSGGRQDQPSARRRRIPSSARGEAALGGAGRIGGAGGIGVWIERTVGPPGDRRTRLIAVAGVLVALLVIGLYAVVNGRATERRNLGEVAALARDHRAVARLTVVQQRASEGLVTTELRWVELDPSGAQGNERTLTVPGEAVHVGVTQATLTHRRLDDPLQLVYFSDLAGVPGEATPLIDGEGPFYYVYRGDRQSSVRRTLRRVWRVLEGSRTPPGYLDVSTQQLAGKDLNLLLGEEWELSLTPTGAVQARRLRSPLDAYDQFDLARPVTTSSGLQVSIAEAIRQVEFAEQIDPELVVVRLLVRLSNGGGGALTIDPNLFQLQDDRRQVYRPARTSRVVLSPGAGQAVRVRFLVPPHARHLRFTIPGETVAGGDGQQPLAVFLDRGEAYLGDVLAVGDYLVALEDVRREATAEGFVLEAVLALVNASWEDATLAPEQFTLEGLRYERSDPVTATSISLLNVDPYLPEHVAVTFDVGEVMDRADPTLRFTTRRKKVVHEAGTFVLLPIPGAEAAVESGLTYLRQMAGAHHYLRYLELTPSGRRGVLGLLTDKKAREREALRHLDLAESYFPESALVAAAR